MDVQREMTLEEWVERLPSFHLAHREYVNLRNRIEELKSWREEDAEIIANLARENVEQKDRIKKLEGEIQKFIYYEDHPKEVP